MSTPVIVGAARTAIGRSFKGTLVNTPPETLITTVLPEVVRRSGVDPSAIDDLIFAESHYGGGDLARYAADATGMEDVPGQSVNRHCAGSLTAIGNASAQIGSGMERALIAGGVQSLSMTPLTNWRIPGPELKFEERWMPPTHVETPDAPTKDMSITVGWNTAQAVGITREEMDAWAARSHQRAIAAMDAGKFIDEIIPLKVQQLRRFGGRFQRRRASASRHHRREAGRAEAVAPGDRRVLDHRGQQQRHQRRGRGRGTRRACLRRRREADDDGDREGLGRSGCRAARLRARRREGHRQGAGPRRAEAVRRRAVGDQRGVRVGARSRRAANTGSTRSW